MIHIVYCDKKNNELEKILKGSKTMIGKSFDSRRIPHSRVFISDFLYFIEKGTDKITCKATVKDVHNFVRLYGEDANKIIENNKDKLCLQESEREKLNKKCLCLIEFENIEHIEPIAFKQPNTLNDWYIFDSIEDVKLLKK